MIKLSVEGDDESGYFPAASAFQIFSEKLQRNISKGHSCQIEPWVGPVSSSSAQGIDVRSRGRDGMVASPFPLRRSQGAAMGTSASIE